MKKIEVLGSGCPKCQKTTDLIKNELRNLDVEAEIVKVEELDEIVNRGVMMTPAVVIDGEIKVEGKVPSSSEIRSWFE
ncbi:thioredoxin family protein [Halothermothrix orenii]|uniref:Redox-active disulfide protein 2 n=1 Tax=Halothermothrix orenii (strain H 168 / OCM 544 / DSM 9562) TaxID=373903 RepID=B8CZQ3_HALOH|nr:thioredoxin family protein [Halothermothrix orenii]ACL70755.1 redox-active disulfide protein 2 [Halothermothrix orenii H 168]